jgi:hypothetical protein
VTNVAPKVVTVPVAESVGYGKSKTIPLAKYFADDDGDDITMIATYKRNGGTTVTIPNGIFTVTSAFTIEVISTSVADIGVYVITMTVSDDFPKSVTTSFTLNVTNSAPKVVFLNADVSLVHKSSLNIPLAKNFTDDDGDAITMTANY